MVNDWLVVWIFVPFSWGNFIIPTDEVHHFFRGVAQPPTRCVFFGDGKVSNLFIHHVLVTHWVCFAVVGHQYDDGHQRTVDLHGAWIVPWTGARCVAKWWSIAMDRKWGVPNGPACFCWYKTIFVLFQFWGSMMLNHTQIKKWCNKNSAKSSAGTT